METVSFWKTKFQNASKMWQIWKNKAEKLIEENASLKQEINHYCNLWARVQDENNILEQAVEVFATPLEYKAIMLEIKSLRQTNKED